MNKRAVWAVIVTGALYLSACGDSVTAPSSISEVASTSTIANGHTHTVNISASEQMRPLDTTFTSSATQGHTHTVALSAGQISTIASGGSVTVTSGSSTVTGNHTHDFTFQGKK